MSLYLNICMYMFRNPISSERNKTILLQLVSEVKPHFQEVPSLIKGI